MTNNNMRVVRRFLVINAKDGATRTTMRLPKPHFGEFVYRLSIRIPKTWSEVLGEMTIDVPEPLSDVAVGTPELGEEVEP